MIKPTKGLLIAFVLNLICNSEGHAAIITAGSCMRTDVEIAVASAEDGDEVVIPAGTCSWTSQLTVTKGITIRGAGRRVTILQDNVPKDGSDISSLLRFDVASPRTFRFSNLTIEGMTTDPSVFNRGHVALTGTSKAFRVDNIQFNNQQTSAIRIEGDLWGVIDHSTFNGSFKQGVVVFHDNWGGKDFGDGSWAEQLYLGTERAIYIEDCVFNDDDPIGAAGAVDMLGGARVVFRHNTLSLFVTHGTDSSKRMRGARSYEIYNNTFTAAIPDFFTAINLRGGTGVIYNNDFNDGAGNYAQIINAQNFRSTEGPFDPWGACNGSSPFDGNLGGQSGYP